MRDEPASLHVTPALILMAGWHSQQGANWVHKQCIAPAAGSVTVLPHNAGTASRLQQQTAAITGSVRRSHKKHAPVRRHSADFSLCFVLELSNECDVIRALRQRRHGPAVVVLAAQQASREGSEERSEHRDDAGADWRTCSTRTQGAVHWTDAAHAGEVGAGGGRSLVQSCRCNLLIMLLSASTVAGRQGVEREAAGLRMNAEQDVLAAHTWTC